MKFINHFLLIIFSLFFVKTYYIAEGNHSNITLDNFAFGSCYGGFLKNRMDMFKIVLKSDPQMWLWVGDATYLDFFTYNYLRKDFGFDSRHVEKMFNETKFDECKNFFIFEIILDCLKNLLLLAFGMIMITE
jgi:hypothetical protein